MFWGFHCHLSGISDPYPGGGMLNRIELPGKGKPGGNATQRVLREGGDNLPAHRRAGLIPPPGVSSRRAPCWPEDPSPPLPRGTGPGPLPLVPSHEILEAPSSGVERVADRHVDVLVCAVRGTLPPDDDFVSWQVEPFRPPNRRSRPWPPCRRKASSPARRSSRRSTRRGPRSGPTWGRGRRNPPKGSPPGPEARCPSR